ncbi:hypothetical protein D3C72_1176930 [compost metagenome]
MTPPAVTVVAPTVPLPPNRAPLPTVTAELAMEPFTTNEPASIWVAPVYVLVPDKVNAPVPCLSNPPDPLSVPEYVVLVLSAPSVSVALPSCTVPAPDSAPSDCP